MGKLRAARSLKEGDAGGQVTGITQAPGVLQHSPPHPVPPKQHEGHTLEQATATTHLPDIKGLHRRTGTDHTDGEELHRQV